MRHSRHLVIFTRYPSFGTGKRRLAAGVGAATALRFQRVSLAHTLQHLGSDRRWRIWLAVTPDRSGPWPSQYGFIPQGEGDLGTRLQRVCAALPRGSVLVIGSDVPGLTRDLISRAFHALEGHEAVIGPSGDGGYWAIGLRRRPTMPDPFRAVRWSTEYALADTLSNLVGRSVARLPQLDDIDDANALALHPRWERMHARCRG
ncbi:TIGR04282 family arsenosugar biosynthesis glycosyltransferase [Hyphomicrobium sp. NDB2Meth4]|uniref:TIGR04282 family arsenosugar biosynthesis glycosyltransferase n=1 Tax=Hyphomicrobium sp. NDB2Meth4 TaxID=1892846 RepID=UPI00093126A3|nr:TIGR04282 family arsenosugar biosynthesis glycosyltransferase [Hyphomicrobium sp. NDB2Meth4]